MNITEPVRRRMFYTLLIAAAVFTICNMYGGSVIEAFAGAALVFVAGIFFAFHNPY